MKTQPSKALCALFLASVTMPLSANLVVNGDFEATTNILNGTNGVGYLGYNTYATGWSNTGPTGGRPNAFNFIVDANAISALG